MNRVIRQARRAGYLRAASLVAAMCLTGMAGAAGVRGLSVGHDVPATAGHANAHALLMAVGQPGLPGIEQDLDQARWLAHRLAVPEDNVLALRGAELGADKMRQMLAGLDQLARGDEEILVYFSGPGSHVCVDGKPAEALVLGDGSRMALAEIEQRLRTLSERTRRVMVWLDAGFAPGAEGQALAAKYLAPEPGCGEPGLKRGLKRGLAVGKDPYAGSNYVKIAAAAVDEAAYAAPGVGSLATRAWVGCLAGGALDADASSGLSVHELLACAATRQRALLAEHGGAPVAAATEAPAPDVAGNADMVVADAPVDSEVRAPDPVAALRDILANRDARRQVSLVASQDSYRIGRDEVGFEIRSSHAGHVYLLMVGSDGKTFDLLFPNRKDTDNRIEAGASLALPRPSWRIRAGGPAGENHLLALVTDAPRDFSSLELRAAGPFSIAAVTPGNTRGLRVAADQGPACAPKKSRFRTLLIEDAPAPAPESAPAGPAAQSAPTAAEACANSYGAALITLREVE